MTDDTKPLHIIGLEVENFKRLRAVSLKPRTGVYKIAGKNYQGKSSLLDAIGLLLAGASELPKDPIRHGAHHADLVADFGDIVVERHISPTGAGLLVKDRAGNKFSSPQTMLNALWTKVAIDPSAFAREDPPKQDELLRKALGLDFTTLNTERKAAETARAGKNKDVKALDARVKAMPAPEAGLPLEPVSVKELLEQQKKNEGVLEDNRRQRAAVEAAQQAVVDLDYDIEQIDLQLAELTERRKDLLVRRAEAANSHGSLIVKADQLVDPDTQALRDQIATAEETNAKIRSRNERAKLEADLAQARDDADQLTARMAEIDAEKQAQLEAAKFPIPGLSFNDLGPLLNGAPLEQASQAEKILLGASIAAAQNPRLRVIVARDASFLDNDSMAALEKFAAENDFQIFAEVVSKDGSGEGCAVLIEDGLAREIAPEAAE